MTRETCPPDRAAAGISQFLVQVHGEEREALLAYAIEQGYGVDVSEFISQHLLDDGPRCVELVGWYRSRLPDVPGLVTFHGALVSEGLSVPAVIEVPGVAGARASIEYLGSVDAEP